MKLFILFTLFCGIIALITNDPTEQTKIITYNSIETNIINCKTYDTTDATKCSECHSGFQLAGDKKSCTRILTNIPIPPYVSGNNIIHPEIGYDQQNNTCTKTIKIYNAAGQTEITTDKYYGAQKSCLACSKYKSDGKCEICVAGYLENKGGCTPMDLKLFKDDSTHRNCIYGAYDANGNPVCYACGGYSRLENNLCIEATNINNIKPGCLKLSYFASNNLATCLECQAGYTLITSQEGTESDKVTVGKCYASSLTPDKCMIIDNKNQCTRCIPGYYLDNSNMCLKCEPYMPKNTYFEKEECNSISTSHCECNPNCIVHSKHFQSCVSRHCTLFSDTEMSTKNKKNPKCLRCEQGYRLDENNECVTCENDCFTDSSKTKCIAGYYLSKAVNGTTNVCRACEGKCSECVSKDTCKENKIVVSNLHGFALNGKPCYDPNCALCSSDDQTVCLKCNSESIKLIGGRCYVQSTEQAMYTANPFKACRYYEEPAFMTNKNAAVDYTSSSVNKLTPTYMRTGINEFTIPDSTDKGYYCKYYDGLPYYYRKYDGQLKCAGENRDPSNDCECISGYYSESVKKDTNCSKTDVPYCVKALSQKICSKCAEGMVLQNTGTKSNPVFTCGCPKTNQRINSNGVCVECPSHCATCVTDYSTGSATTNCTSCYGLTVADDEDARYKALSYNRNVSNNCACNEGYTAYTAEEPQKSYVCFQVPAGCKKQGNYNIAKYSMKCTACDKVGFTLDSGCKSCLDGYYFDSKNTAENLDDDECRRCPIIEQNVDITYCANCQPDQNNKLVCGECLESNLNPANDCLTCNEGYSKIYVKDSTGKVLPKCFTCPSMCKANGESTCFYAPAGLKTTEQFNAYSSKSRTNPYTQEEYDNSTHLYCRSCLTDTQSPLQDCKCKEQNYLDANGMCQSCANHVGNDQFITKDVEGNVVKGYYRDICDMETTENSGKEICVLNSIKLKPECRICKEPKRTPSSNCTECNAYGIYPVYSNGKHICADCLPKCKTCDNNKNCKECKGSAVTGTDCDKCLDGYYKTGTDPQTGSAICQKCDSTLCATCVDKSNKCLTCADQIRLPGEKNDCSDCVDGYFFNVKERVCVAISTDKGYSASKPVCLDKDGNEVLNCKNDTANQIVNVIEIPTRCETTKNVGVSPYPVNRTCVCDKGYYDIRNATEKEANPIPQCTNIKIVTGDDFCIDGKYDATSKKVVCTECNAPYLELKNGKCTCKNTYYATSWGMCVPCGRHMKGCVECTGKHKCTKCDESSYKLGDEKDGKRECVGK